MIHVETPPFWSGKTKTQSILDDAKLILNSTSQTSGKAMTRAITFGKNSDLKKEHKSENVQDLYDIIKTFFVTGYINFFFAQ